MKPTKQQIIQMLTDVEQLRKEDNARMDAWRALFDVVAQDSYPPIMDDSKMDGYLLAVRAVFGDVVEDDITYWAYDAFDMKKKDRKARHKGTEYDISTKEKYANFMLLD